MEYGFPILTLIFGGCFMLYALVVKVGGFRFIPRNWAVRATDQDAYANEFAKVIAILALSPILSGLIGLVFGEGVCGIVLAVSALAAIAVCAKTHG